MAAMRTLWFTDRRRLRITKGGFKSSSPALSDSERVNFLSFFSEEKMTPHSSHKVQIVWCNLLQHRPISKAGVPCVWCDRAHLQRCNEAFAWWQPASFHFPSLCPASFLRSPCDHHHASVFIRQTDPHQLSLQSLISYEVFGLTRISVHKLHKTQEHQTQVAQIISFLAWYTWHHAGCGAFWPSIVEKMKAKTISTLTNALASEKQYYFVQKRIFSFILEISVKCFRL